MTWRISSYRLTLCLGLLWLACSSGLADPAWDACLKAPPPQCLLDEAGREAQAIPDLPARVAALSAIAQAQTALDRKAAAASTIADALRLTRSIAEDDGQGDALKAVGAALAQTGEFTQALALIQSIKQFGTRMEALRALAQTAAKAGATEQAKAAFASAFELARSRDKPYPKGDEHLARVFSLRDVAEAQARVGLVDDAASTLALASQEARAVERETERSIALSVVAMAMIHTRQIPSAMQLLAQMDDSARASTLGTLAVAEAETGNLVDAATQAEALTDTHWRQVAFTAVAVADARAGLAPAAETSFGIARLLARSGRSDLDRLQALADVAQAESQAGLPKDAEADFTAVNEATQSIKDDTDRMVVMQVLVEPQAKAGRFSEAMASAAAQSDAEIRDGFYAVIARAESEAGRFGDALQTAQRISTAGDKVSAYSLIAAKLPN